MKSIYNFILEKLVLNKDTKIFNKFEHFGEGEYIDFDINKLTNHYNFQYTDAEKKEIYNLIPHNSSVYYIKNANYKNNTEIYKLLRKYESINKWFGNKHNQIHIYQFKTKRLLNLLFLIHIYDSPQDVNINDIYIYEKKLYK